MLALVSRDRQLFSMTDQVQLPFYSEESRPFLKWAGGKRQLLPQLMSRIPTSYNRYFEPFVGAGALFFALRPPKATLSDANERLIRTYIGIRDNVHAVVELLSQYPNQKEFFLSQRERDIDSSTNAEIAAWMLYLNRTGYNGLYRVNRQGKFNVPFGRYERPKICDAQNLCACSRLLRDVSLLVADFETVVEEAQAGDFVYFDPPYVAASRYSDFSRYTPGGFSDADQVRLRNVAAKLKNRGVHVLLSNSDTDDVRHLYSNGFEVFTVSAPRFINSQANGRGNVPELLIG